MNYIFIGFALACGFGIASTYYFLKASSIYFSYKESVRRITKGQVEMPNWRFVVPLKENKEIESDGLRRKRMEHQKYITRYWSLIIIMLGLVAFALTSTPNT